MAYLHENQRGDVGLWFISVVVVLTAIGYAGWRVYQARQNSPELSSDTPSAQLSETDEASIAIPENFIEYENKDVGIKFAYPKDWRQHTCNNTKDISFLIKKKNVKCATEDRPDGPYFSFTDQGMKSCDDVGSGSEFDKTTCQKVTVGKHEIILSISTYTKEGMFGEPKGAMYYEYSFVNSDLVVGYSFWPPNEENHKETVEKVIQSIVFE